MKKIMSVIMSVLIAVSMFAMGGQSAFAVNLRSNAPTLEVGSSVTLKATKSEETFFIKFTPTETRYYEFWSDAALKGDAALEISITDSTKKSTDDDYSVATTYLFDTYANDKFGAKLTTNTLYYLEIDATDISSDFTTNISAANHTSHTLTDYVDPAIYINYTDGITFKSKNNGYTAKVCSVCNYEKKTGVIYAPSKITLSKKSYTYNGKAKKPSVTIKDTKGKTIPSSEYIVEYSKNKKVGNAVATIEASDSAQKYGIFATVYFKILPKGTSISKLTSGKKCFTVKYKKQATQTTGYQIQYSTDKNFKKNTKTVTVSKNKTTSKKVKKLKSKKKYFVRIRTYKNVKDSNSGKTKKYCSAWSKTKTVKTK